MYIYMQTYVKWERELNMVTDKIIPNLGNRTVTLTLNYNLVFSC